MYSGKTKIALLAFLLGVVLTSRGQGFAQVRIETTLEPSQITIGDPILYRVLITRPKGTQILTDRSAIPLGKFEFLSSQLGQDQEIEGTITTEDRHQISIYETGQFNLPPLKIEYQTADGVRGEVTGEEHTVTVVSVAGDIQQAQNIRDIKPELVLGRPAWQNLLFWAGILLLIGLLAAIVRWLILRSRKPKPAAPPAPPLPAHEIAYRALEEIRQDKEGLIARKDFELFSVRVSTVIREYLWNRFGLPAVDRTTEETLVELHKLHFSPQVLKEFEEFLIDCDLVKFAQEALERSDMLYLVDLAWKMVDHTREQQILPPPTTEEASPERFPDSPNASSEGSKS